MFCSSVFVFFTILGYWVAGFSFYTALPSVLYYIPSKWLYVQYVVVLYTYVCIG